MTLVNDRARRFLSAGGWFDQRFGQAPQDRYATFKSALGLFLQRLGDRRDGVILETGTQRFPDDWGAGCSTTVFGETLAAFDAGLLWSVDLSMANIQVSRHCTQAIGQHIKYVCSDSIAFLSQFAQASRGISADRVDLLYLDSYDWTDDPAVQRACQEHQLQELQAIYPQLAPGAVVLLDDNALPGGGKTQLAKAYLADRSWTCILDHQQSLWLAETIAF